MKVHSFNFSRFCDSTCTFCAREFWAWLKSRNAQMSMSLEGGTDFASAAATSVRPTEQTDTATRLAGAESACHTPGK